VSGRELLFGRLHEATVLEAAREVARPAAILDVGCGKGELVRFLEKRFPEAELVGVDPGEGVVKKARAAAHGAPVRFVEACAEQLPFSDGCFDLVVSTMSFYHWGDQRRGLREVRRVLARGGLLVLTSPLASGWLRWAAVFGRGHLLRPEQLDALLATQRLRFVRRTSLAWPWGVAITVAQAVD
jgi:ubiquinone/menaquinone biosynthesis C-methylase UbiE